MNKTPSAWLCLLSCLCGFTCPGAWAAPEPASILAPESWPEELRQRLESHEAQTWAPSGPRTTRTAGGVVAATVSPLAVEAGRRALDAGGTAADAAVTVALTQVTTELGSVVSYAGIATALYYEAASGRVSALDAGYDSYAGETDPLTIPRADLGALQPGATPEATDAHGRKTLVPGFMAGIEALHSRHGRLPFRDLVAPAIAYAESGVTISPVLAGFFAMRASAFQRTAEGRAFLAQSGRDVPQVGDRFRQPALATTLRAVAARGSAEMYTGDWAREFVALVRREGGRVEASDLAGYVPTWTEAHAAAAFGHTVHLTPLPNTGAFSIVLGLNLASELQFATRGPVWREAEAWAALARITAVTSTAPLLNEALAGRLRAAGLDPAPMNQLTPEFARGLARLLPELPAPVSTDQPRHSNAIAVVDAAGNVCVLTHTINAVVWGGSGLVVGGIPLPDSAGFQQVRLAHVPPGGRVPHEIVDTIVMREGRPVLATASIGSSLAAETLRVLVSTIAQGQPFADVLAAPTQLSIFGPAPLDASAGDLPALVPEGAYPQAFLEAVRAHGVLATPVPGATVEALRGTIVAIALDGTTGERTAVERPDIMVFHATQEPPAESR